ncbi:MAG: hypothetical protein FJ134_00720 [Deltaproteobacteria bacterium]|nr:hypothetical protein [Deltaproteobacteria bacterium]
MLVTYALTLLVSAFLLFLVQPMFAKMVLPLLGGTPAVWNTCMVFYQGALLAGYAYAHGAPSRLGVRRQAVLHLGLLSLAATLALPIGVAPGWTPPTGANPVPWLLLLLLVSVGFPFFVVSATAPLLQKWFAHTSHAAAPDPYFLYGASNLGSMLALLCYPLVVEPFLSLRQQAWAWGGGYLALTVFIGGCAVMLWRFPTEIPPAAARVNLNPHGDAGSGPLTWGRKARWVLLSLVPSSLLLGVTTYISTDIAAAPLLWVIPLALYLLTFVLVCARKPPLSHDFMVRLEPLGLATLVLLFLLQMETGTWPLIFLHLMAFFLIAMVCHGELMQLRPAASHLTEFYLWISVGGVLGGMFNALAAPLLFRSLAEYPLMVAAACFLRPGSWGGKQPVRLLDFLLVLAQGALVAGALRAPVVMDSSLLRAGIIALLAGLIAWFSHRFRDRPLGFGLGMGALLLASAMSLNSGSILYASRNFFGVLQVKLDENGSYYLLTHGTTLHGAQSLDPALYREPLTYYHPTGPLGQVFAAFSPKLAQGRIAVIGLGTGSIAGYGRPGQHFTFYEIDPGVVKIARDSRYFTFLEDCPAEVEVILGDGRLALQHSDASYDLIILDAFSSDAIPVHLITREALRVYLSKLQDGGILACHITNRYLDLIPVFGSLARDAGLAGIVRQDFPLIENSPRKSPSLWAVLARQPADLALLAADSRWRPLDNSANVLWTDDFSNILAVFKWHSFFSSDPRR